MAVKTENTVQFNLKNVHYAVLTTDTTASVVFGSPVAIPGAVTLNLNQVGDISKFYADGLVYWQGASNNGYEGDAEFARLPEQMLTDVWGMGKKPTDNVIMENVADKQASFAIMFQVDGDVSENLYVFYNCTATRPDIAAETTKESKEPKVQKLKFSAAPLKNGNIKACTAADTPDEVRTAWFTTVYQPKE